MMRPERLTRRELLSTLQEIVAGVDSGDTLEGNIAWALPEDDDPDGWDVVAAYRVGNTMGQGGTVLIGKSARQLFGTISTAAHDMIVIRTGQPFDEAIPAGTFVSITLIEPEPRGVPQPDSGIVIRDDPIAGPVEG